MPRIPEFSKAVAFYLFSSIEDANAGALGATGFFLSIPSEAHSNVTYCYGVTASHVIKNGRSNIRVNGQNGQPVTFELDVSDWEAHPDGYDVSVTRYPVRLDRRFHNIYAVGLDTCMTDEIAKEIDLGIGDDVFMTGRFVDQDAKHVNKPAVRFGNISVMPTQLYHKHTKKVRPSYLLDMHSRTGFSGSPVFMFRTPGANLEESFRKKINVLGSSYLFLLGVHWGQFSEDLEFEIGNYKGSIEGFSGMTMVDPISVVKDLLFMDKFKKDRALEDEHFDPNAHIKLEDEQGAPAPVSGDDLLRVMLNTPPSPRTADGA